MQTTEILEDVPLYNKDSHDLSVSTCRLIMDACYVETYTDQNLQLVEHIKKAAYVYPH